MSLALPKTILKTKGGTMAKLFDYGGTMYDIQDVKVATRNEDGSFNEPVSLPSPTKIVFKAKDDPGEDIVFHSLEIKPVTITLRLTCVTEPRIRMLWRYCDDFKVNFWRENFIHQFRHRYGFSQN